VLGSHGLKGEVKSLSLTDVFENFKKLKRVYLAKEGQTREFEVQWVRFHSSSKVLIKLKGIDTPEEAERLKGELIEIPEDELVPLDAGEYYWFQLIGLEVFTEEGEYLGVLEEIIDTSAHDVYVVRDKEKEILLPAIRQVIKEISLSAKRMIVHLIEGLR